MFRRDKATRRVTVIDVLGLKEPRLSVIQFLEIDSISERRRSARVTSFASSFLRDH